MRFVSNEEFRIPTERAVSIERARVFSGSREKFEGFGGFLSHLPIFTKVKTTISARTGMEQVSYVTTHINLINLFTLINFLFSVYLLLVYIIPGLVDYFMKKKDEEEEEVEDAKEVEDDDD